jgi:hypothetical protein
MHSTEEASKYLEGGSAENQSSTLVKKNSQVCCFTISSFQHFSAWLNTPQEGPWRNTSTPLASPTLAHNPDTSNYLSQMTAIMFFCTFDIFKYL